MTNAESTKQPVIILRGIPGSGKTTFRKTLEEAFEAAGIEVAVASADFFHERSGVYQFDIRNLGASHNACRVAAINALFDGKAVVIDNTNTKRFEYETYLLLAKRLNRPVYVVAMNVATRADFRICLARQTHGVPHDTMRAMFCDWEDDENEIKVFLDDQTTIDGIVEVIVGQALRRN